MRVPLIFLFITVFTSCKLNNKQTANLQSNLSKSSAVYNLCVLAKVWGFLKYYHPAVAAGKYNWDNELIKILPLVTTCKNADERNKLLSDWVKTLGEFKAADDNVLSGSIVKYYPDFRWMNASELGSDLYTQLKQIQKAIIENGS